MALELLLIRSAAISIPAFLHASAINAVDLKYRLGDVETDCPNHLHAGAPLNPGCINRNHTHGTHPPVEEPSTASKADMSAND
jgi:hypothetical protein